MDYESALIKMHEGQYLYSVDLLRFVLVLCIIFTEYGVPIASAYVTTFLSFASGSLFLLYGYFVLRDGTDLRKNIKHTFIVFALMFVVCFAFSIVYMYFVYGTPFAFLSKRGIFNFVVLNYWWSSMGDYIWYVQSILYSLILCYLFRKLKKFDIVICVILFIISFLTGEGAGLIHFSFLRYAYLPGNFLTRTLPYMLLGRIMYRHSDILKELKVPVYILIIVAGFGLSAAELFGLSALGLLVYHGHFIGFILIAFGLAGLAIQKPQIGKKLAFRHYALYKKVFFLFNPIGEITLVVLGLLLSTQQEYNIAYMFAGILICVITLVMVPGWEAVAGFIDRIIMPKLSKSNTEDSN